MPVDVGDVFPVRMDEEHGEDGEHETYHQDGFSFYKCKYFLHNVSRFCKVYGHYNLSPRGSVMTCARISVFHYNLSPRDSVMTCARISVLHYNIEKTT